MILVDKAEAVVESTWLGQAALVKSMEWQAQGCYAGDAHAPHPVCHGQELAPARRGHASAVFGLAQYNFCRHASKMKLDLVCKVFHIGHSQQEVVVEPISEGNHQLSLYILQRSSHLAYCT